MIQGFEQQFVNAGDVTLSVHRAGHGMPLILLHGYPQNHHCWAKIAPTLAEHFDVIIPDLRGYGQSDAPADDANHTVYAKRTMAADIAGMMDSLGIERAHILGHDRGARVAYRFGLDHPNRIDRLGIIEIVPTSDFWAGWDQGRAMKAYHWTFLAQPAPLPERMIAAGPADYVDWTLASWTKDKALDAFREDALTSYRDQMADPARCAAMCADYRAGATTDRQIDEIDRKAGRKINASLHFLCGIHGFPAQTGNPTALWENWADQVTSATCDAGHFAMEENPDAIVEAFLPFFAGA